jgi:hypothetical protein
MKSVLAQEGGAFHSRTIENRMAAEKSAKASLFPLIPSIMARESLCVATKPLTTGDTEVHRVEPRLLSTEN